MGLTVAEQEATLLTSSHGSSLEDAKYSQATERVYRIWTDQWGREWGSDCEKRTMHPCGPFSSRFTAPLAVPQKYVVITDSIRAKIWIDTRRWIYDLIDAHRAYWTEVQKQASRIAGTQSFKLYDQSRNFVDDDLLRLVGKPPLPVEVLQAMRAGNRWILGLPMPDGSPAAKPEAAPRDYFPDQLDIEREDPLREHDPWGEATISEEEAARIAMGNVAVLEYPHHYGGGWWWLNDAHRVDCEQGLRPGFRGSKVEAIRAAERGELPEDEGAAETPIHNSWGE